MRKLVLVLLIVIVSLVGCTEKIDNDLEIVNREPEKIVNAEEEKLTILEDYEKALRILDSNLNSGIDERINIQEGIGEVEIQRINNRYYLGSYYNFPRLPLTNLYYSIIDLEEEALKPIEELKYDDYIEEVYIDIENMNIRFIYNGINIINGFRQYPYDLVYNVETGEYKKENDYTKVDRYSKTTVGNGINIMGLKFIETKNKEITFAFTEVEGTILAGGSFCPKITIGRKLEGKGYITGKEPVKLYIDFENTILTERSKEGILALENMDYISNVEIREYLDANEGNHVVVYLTLKDIDEYRGDLNYNEETGLDDFILILR